MATPRIHPAAAPDQTAAPSGPAIAYFGLATYGEISGDIQPGDLESDAEHCRTHAQSILLAARWADRNIVAADHINNCIEAATHLLELAKELEAAAVGMVGGAS